MQVPVLDASRMLCGFGMISMRQEIRHLDEEEECLIFQSADIFASTCVCRRISNYYYGSAFAFIFAAWDIQERRDIRSSGLPTSETFLLVMAACGRDIKKKQIDCARSQHLSFLDSTRASHPCLTSCLPQMGGVLCRSVCLDDGMAQDCVQQWRRMNHLVVFRPILLSAIGHK